MKTNLSPLLGSLVRVGAVDEGHFTEAGHVALLPPEPSCFRKTIKLLPDDAEGKVKVQFPVRVSICKVPLSKFIV